MCPTGCGAYLHPTAVWQQGHPTEAAFSPSPRLRANAVSLNPSQFVASPDTGGGGGGRERSGSEGV